MTYVDGFVTAVPTANREKFVEHAESAVPLFKQFGAARDVECWADDVPHGQQTDFYRAVQAKEDESVVFSWIEYPDRDTRDQAGQQMMESPEMEALSEMPFDGKRMIYGGFDVIHEQGDGRGSFVDGILLAVPRDNRDAYLAMCDQTAPMFRKHGAVRTVECWEDDVAEGKLTDFRRAVQAKPDEAVVFSWIEWPDKAARDRGMRAAMDDMPEMLGKRENMPFDPQRMIYGSFAAVINA